MCLKCLIHVGVWRVNVGRGAPTEANHLVWFNNFGGALRENADRQTSSISRNVFNGTGPDRRTVYSDVGAVDDLPVMGIRIHTNAPPCG